MTDSWSVLTHDGQHQISQTPSGRSLPTCSVSAISGPLRRARKVGLYMLAKVRFPASNLTSASLGVVG